ncbi:MAG TPA: ATP-binding protein, partial [Dehalococcoidia bacterium]|nr:ATP-binding protein [Dehalococcoidia bacterium]
LLLIGLLQKGGAVNLVFDMHNEYGWEGTSEGPAGKVKGLKQLFSSKVAVFTVDQESAVRRGVNVDEVVRIGWDEIEPQDIELLQETLNLTEAGVGAVYAMARQRGRRWLSDFLAAEAPGERADLTTALGEHEATIAALHRRLGRLRDFHFLTEGRSDALQRLLNALEGGRHVVLEFGRYSNNLTAYLLVANFLTRRVHQRWVRRTEEALGDRAQEPPQLVITLEEAHRFLSPAIAPRTIFGTIAREMRKYHATLLIIDQRPSGIDDEVLSQLGTKLCYRLDDDADIDAVLAGAAGRSDLKTVLANLDAKQQVLAFGDALPMPVVVRVREYGSPQSYRELGIESEEEHKARVQRDMERMFGA